MLIQRLDARGLLSFGPQGIDLGLRPLNVLIGPNGSGKSNLLESITLLKAAPRDLAGAILRGGNAVRDWIWSGEPAVAGAAIEAILENPEGSQNLRFDLGFTERGQRFEVTKERITNEHAYEGFSNPYIYYENEGGRATLNYRDTSGSDSQRHLRIESVDTEQSILAQRRDPDHYPVLTHLAETLDRIRFYREWEFGRDTVLRTPQKTDRPNDFLREDGKNLGLVLNNLRRSPRVKNRLLEALRRLYDGITDFGVIIEANTVQVCLYEGEIEVPATRLSDGTLRYLCLLAILCHPNPPPLVCIEEPELGLHPDVLPTLTELLLEASERGQLIVTTHSEVLVDALTHQPECVVICEKHQGQTRMRRLKADELAEWLKRHGLGELWLSGEIGGNRW